MKKLLLLLTLFISIHSFGQEHSHKATSFDKAVTASDWQKVEKIIRKKIKSVSKKHGENGGEAEMEFTRWLSEQHTVGTVLKDECAVHIMIFPGWNDYGIVFNTAAGKKEFHLAIQLGMIGKGGAVMSGIYLKAFKEDTGIISRIEQTCKELKFNDLRNWQPQEDIEIRTELLDDRIVKVAGSYPVIRVKVAFYNISGKPLEVLWPQEQNMGNKSIVLEMVNLDGTVLSESKTEVDMNHYSDKHPSVITLQPGDSLVAIHSLNDAFAYSSDVEANHTIRGITPGDWALSVHYQPSGDGDYWTPATGLRKVYCQKLVKVEEPLPAEKITLLVKLLDDFFYYTNKYDHQCAYDGMVEVINAPPGSGISPGDTIAYTVPLDFVGDTADTAHLDYAFIISGNTLSLDLNIALPYDTFTLPESGRLRNYVTVNDVTFIRFIKE